MIDAEQRNYVTEYEASVSTNDAQYVQLQAGMASVCKSPQPLVNHFVNQVLTDRLSQFPVYLVSILTTVLWPHICDAFVISM